MGYSHFYFDEKYRCIQNKSIAEVSNCVLFNEYGKIKCINEYKNGNEYDYIIFLNNNISINILGKIYVIIKRDFKNSSDLVIK